MVDPKIGWVLVLSLTQIRLLHNHKDFDVRNWLDRWLLMQTVAPKVLHSPGYWMKHLWETYPPHLWWSRLTWHTRCYHFIVMIRTYTIGFIYFYMYWYWSHCDSRLYLSTGLRPHCSVDSCAARCCDSELRLTVYYCALWPIVAVTLLFLWRLLFALLYCSCRVFSQACWVASSPRLDFFVVLL